MCAHVCIMSVLEPWEAVCWSYALATLCALCAEQRGTKQSFQHHNSYSYLRVPSVSMIPFTSVFSTTIVVEPPKHGWTGIQIVRKKSSGLQNSCLCGWGCFRLVQS